MDFSSRRAPLTLLLDLGDAFTKALALGEARRQRVRFPSVVAHELLRGGPEMATLAFDEQVQLPRLSDFDAEKYPRTRSFAGSNDFVNLLRDRAPARGARFAGGIAAVYGADRRLFGMHPTEDNVDALLRKAFLLLASGERCDADVVFVIDVGAKANTITRYAQLAGRKFFIEAHKHFRSNVRRIHIAARTICVDATDCVRAALPAELATERVGRTLIIDIGYLRTKFAIVSGEGCEHQQAEHLGVSDCVYRILRDGQEQGLVEDEYAVIRALEACRPERFEVAGRSFDVRAPFESACDALQRELVRVARRIVLEQFGRSGEMCRGVAVIGGGAAIVGARIAEQLKSAIGLSVTWVSSDTSDLLLEGARRIVHGG